MTDTRRWDEPDDHNHPHPIPRDLPEGAFGATVPIPDDEPDTAA